MTEIANTDWFGRWGTSVFSENRSIFPILDLANATMVHRLNREAIMRAEFFMYCCIKNYIGPHGERFVDSQDALPHPHPVVVDFDSISFWSLHFHLLYYRTSWCKSYFVWLCVFYYGALLFDLVFVCCCCFVLFFLFCFFFFCCFLSMCFSCILLIILHALVSVHFHFHLVSGIGCALWQSHSLDFSINFFIVCRGPVEFVWIRGRVFKPSSERPDK